MIRTTIYTNFTTYLGPQNPQYTLSSKAQFQTSLHLIKQYIACTNMKKNYSMFLLCKSIDVNCLLLLNVHFPNPFCRQFSFYGLFPVDTEQFIVNCTFFRLHVGIFSRFERIIRINQTAVIKLVQTVLLFQSAETMFDHSENHSPSLIKKN